MRRLFISFLFTSLIISCFGQDLEYAREVINELSSEKMYGRGYVNNGHQIAADYIKSQYEEIGVEPLDNEYFQSFTFSINTLPGKIDFWADDVQLRPGIDYVVMGSSPSIDETVSTSFFDKEVIIDPKAFEKFKKGNYSKKAIVVDDTKVGKDKIKYFQGMRGNPFNAKVLIFLVDDLTMGLAQKPDDFVTIEILRDALPKGTKKTKLLIENKVETVTSNNVIGRIKGSKTPEKYVVFTGHYDHLGMMGSDVYFPGGNDNASGIAMMLAIAKYFSDPKNTPEYSILFIAFGAEEVGLLGSKYYVDNPRFRMMHIKFLVNMDIMGTGDEGITVVNGSEFEKQFDKLTKINDEFGYLPQIKKRGKAAISDHHWFTEKGIECFFIYTLGGSKAYHDVDDTGPNVSMSKFREVFLLLTDFANEIE